jgi:glycosyltransferase involved in cell wall biosynthesis
LAPVRHVVFPFIGEEMGGSHVSAFTLAAELQGAHGVRATVIAREASLIAREAAARGFGVLTHREPAAGRHNPLYDAIRIPARLAMLRRLDDAAIVHCNDISALQAWLAPARLARRRIVYHHRSLNRMILPNTALIRASDHVFCISGATLGQVGFLPPGRASELVNPFAIDMATSRAEARAALLAEFGLSPNARLVGFIGNFWRRKRADFFLEVAARMRADAPDAAFVLFGREGDLTRGDLEREAERLGLAAHVRFAGFRLPVERNVAALDLLLLTALREPFGRTPIEAALLGTPYVATDDAGHGEIARRWAGGRLVDKGADAAAFAAVAVEALSAPEQIRLPPDARSRLAEEVGPARHAVRVLAVYRALTASPAGRAIGQQSENQP